MGKAGTFSKSIAISSAENVKNIATSPVRLLDNIGNKAADLETIFSKGKGLVGNFTKSVVVSSAKNAKSLLTKVKGTLSDVGTASGAFAKAFGKTYVKECSKYANTCFSMSRAAGAGLEAGYKGFVAGVKEANSALHFDKGAAKAEIKLGKADLDAYRKEIGVPDRNTVAIGKTDIED